MATPQGRRLVPHTRASLEPRTSGFLTLRINHREGGGDINFTRPSRTINHATDLPSVHPPPARHRSLCAMAVLICVRSPFATLESVPAGRCLRIRGLDAEQLLRKATRVPATRPGMSPSTARRGIAALSPRTTSARALPPFHRRGPPADGGQRARYCDGQGLCLIQPAAMTAFIISPSRSD